MYRVFTRIICLSLPVHDLRDPNCPHTMGQSGESLFSRNSPARPRATAQTPFLVFFSFASRHGWFCSLVTGILVMQYAVMLSNSGWCVSGGFRGLIDRGRGMGMLSTRRLTPRLLSLWFAIPPCLNNNIDYSG